MRSRPQFTSSQIALPLVAVLLLSSVVGASPLGGAPSPRTDLPGFDTPGASRGESAATGNSAALAPLTGGNFTIDFLETGLPVASSWSVTLNGTANSSTSGTLGFTAPNGTYPFSVAGVAGFVPVPKWGNLSVSGQSLAVNISFLPYTFDVNFEENGLPGATTWAVTLNGTPHSTATTQVSVTESNGTYPYTVLAPTGFTAEPDAGNAAVDGAAVDVVVNFTAVTYPVVFAQTGLSATNWSVNLSGTESATNGTNLTFSEPNGTYSYSVGTVPGYFATPTSGSVTVTGAPGLVNLTFAANPAGKYPLSFNETGLLPGTSWTVNLSIAHSSSTGSTIVFLKTNGTYAYTISPVAGYTSHPAAGSADLRGPTVVNISFTPFLYSVNFTQQGLASGTNWTVDVGAARLSSTASSLLFAEPNGTAAYAIEPVAGYQADPVNGSVIVVGAPVAVSITFTAVTYTVAFSETGLPAGTAWSVRIGSHTLNGNGSRLSRPEVNGTYSYSLGAVPGYVAIPPSGELTVNGSGAAEAIAFSSFDFVATFTESGLPPDTNWSVTLSGDTKVSTDPSIGFVDPNGTYAYSVPLVPGYTVLPRSGNVTIAGADAHVALVYSPLPPGSYAVTFTETGLESGTEWSVNLSGSVVSSSTNRVVYAEENGSYNFTLGSVTGYGVSPSTGSVSVVGAPRGVSVTYSPLVAPTFEVTFTETGLPSGTNWSVDVNGSLLWGTSPTLGTNLTNGSYPFLIPALHGFNSSQTTGSVDVAGAPVVESLQFSALPVPRFLVTFLESGLPSGTNWSVTLNGTTGSTIGQALVAGSLPPGTYAFTARSSGFTVQPSSGNVTVSTGPVLVNLTFAPGPGHSASKNGALSVPTLVFLVAMGVVVLVAVAIALATRGGRNGPA
jgi:hypothetical protein